MHFQEWRKHLIAILVCIFLLFIVVTILLNIIVQRDDLSARRYNAAITSLIEVRSHVNGCSSYAEFCQRITDAEDYPAVLQPNDDDSLPVPERFSRNGSTYHCMIELPEGVDRASTPFIWYLAPNVSGSAVVLFWDGRLDPTNRCEDVGRLVADVEKTTGRRVAVRKIKAL